MKVMGPKAHTQEIRQNIIKVVNYCSTTKVRKWSNESQNKALESAEDAAEDEDDAQYQVR